MRFTITDELPYPRDLVFKTHRDKLQELVEYLPNIESVECKSRKENGPITKLENFWTGTTSDVPAVLRPIIKAQYLTWTDFAEWDEENHRCSWNIVLGVLPNSVTARGVNIFREEGDETIVDITGEFIVHPNNIPHVPNFVAKKATPAIEKFVVSLLKPNLRMSNAAVVEYIDDNE